MRIKRMILALAAALAVLSSAAIAERDTHPTQQTGIQPPEPPTDGGDGVYGGPEPDPHGPPDDVYGGPEPDPNGPPDGVAK